MELPFLGLALKRRHDDQKHNEAEALRFANSHLAGLVEAPLLIDSVFLPDKNAYCWTLMTHVSGDVVLDVWDQLTEADKEKLAQQLRTQVDAMYATTVSLSGRVTDAGGGPITDHRILWMGRDEEAVVFESTKAFAQQVWPTTPYETELAKVVRPFIEREHVPVVFCHGDLLPRNLILPGGLALWKKGIQRVCIIDWETAAWAPHYWDALKATWLDTESGAPWVLFIRNMFPYCNDILDIDWEWRSRTRITIL